MLKQLKDREKKLAIMTVSLLGLIGVYFLLLEPYFSRLKGIREEIYKQSILLSRYQKVLSFRQKIEKVYGDYLGVVKVGGTTQEEISKFLQEVEQLSQKAQVHIVDMKPLGMKESESLNKVKLEIEVDADQANLGRLLFEIKNSQAMIHVDSLKVSAGMNGEALKCDLVLSRIVT